MLTVLVLPLFMALMSVSIVNVSLPAIQQGLHASTAQLQWVLSGFALTFGLLLVPAGRLGDVVGRRTLFLVGVALFTLTSLGAALATSATTLNLWRVAMGIGSGVLNPQIIGLVQQHFHGAERARAFGVMGAFIGMAMAVGPLLGGLIIGAAGPDLGWRWTFGVNVPVGLLTLLVAWRWLPREDRHPGARRAAGGGRARTDLDPVGVVLFGASILLVMLPFLHVTDAAWIWGSLPAGALALLGWLAWERRYRGRGHDPMVDLALLRERGFAFGTVLILCYFIGLAPSWAVLAIFVQDGLGHSALVAGVVTVPAALAGAVASAAGGRLVTRWGRPLVAWGAALAVAGQLATGLVAVLMGDHRLVLWALAASFVAIGAAQGLVIGPNQSLTLAAVPIAHGGAAGGVMQTGQRVGAAIGLAVGTGVLFATLGARDWPQAVLAAFLSMSLATSVALVVAVVDARRRRDRGESLRGAVTGPRSLDTSPDTSPDTSAAASPRS